MDYGGVDKRRTKNDLKKKRINRGYKKGGQFRTANVDEVEAPGSQRVPLKGREKRDKMGKLIESPTSQRVPVKGNKASKKKKRKY